MTRWRTALLLLTGLAACARPERSRPALPADPLFTLGDSLYRAQRYDSARAVWALALDRAKSRSDSTAQAALLTEIGQADYWMGNLPDARRAQEQALALKTTLRLGDSALARSHNALGLVAEDEGRNDEAVRHFEQAIELARSAGDAATLARASGNIGLAFQNLGRLRPARAAFRTLREAGHRMGDARLEGNGLANEASVDIWEGDPGPALARLDTARGLYRQAAYATGEEYALGQLATAYQLTGEFDRAFAALESALEVARAQNLRGEEADNLRLMAGLHADVGDWRRAIRYYEQADSVLRLAGFDGTRGSVMRGAATAYLALGNGGRARSHALEALRLHLASGEALDQLDDLLVLAAIEGSSDPAASGRRIREARFIAAALDSRGARLLVAVAEARGADRRGDSHRVLAVVGDAGRDLTPGDAWAEWELNALAARAEARLGALDSAADRGRRAVAAIERERGSLSSDALRATLVTERADVYGDLVLVLLRLGRTDEAFAVAESARSRGLIEHIAAARSGTVMPELIRSDELLRRIDQLMRRLREVEPTRPLERGAVADSAQHAIIRAIVAARTEYEGITSRMGERPSRSAALLGAGATRLDDVREALDPDEVMLEYLINSDRLIVFVLRRDGFRVLNRALDPSALRHRVELLRDLWGRGSPDWRLGLPAARALYQTLIGPVREAGLLNAHRRLVIVPHGLLGQLPFAALVDVASGRFLGQDYTVMHLPSAAALVALRRPIEAAAIDAGEGLAPFPKELPATAGEIEAFRAALPGAVGRLGRDATEAEVRRALIGTGAVHVATHGTLNVRNPMFSRIELAAPKRGSSPADDGRLEAHELIGMAIRSPLLFLSGCETGAGQAWGDDPVRGTADLTLAQAALAAGARNVISTLWRIQDGGAGVFARRFYTHLRRAPASTALAEAQRETLSDPAYASPFYWAGYVLSGEGRFGGGSQFEPAASVSPSNGMALTAFLQARRLP